VVQVNTGPGGHLDASMLNRALGDLSPAPGSLLFIENVGNLICPARHDLGESGKVVIVSVTEGTDKPLKYRYMFAAADLVVINKMDLLPYVDFDVDACRLHVASVNPAASVVTVSATRGDNLTDWYGWLFS
jgi:hydrogenase nickel incorporation protein HypB